MVDWDAEVAALRERLGLNRPRHLADAHALIRHVHDRLDEYNAAHGAPGALCAFCEADAYDGVEGIRHRAECLITELRRAMRALERLD